MRCTILKARLGAAAVMVILGGVAHADWFISPALSGSTQVDQWSSASLTTAANPGFPSFPGTGPWPGTIGSSSGGDAELVKTADGAGGGPIPLGGSLYFGGISATPNTNGGTLSVIDGTPVDLLKNVVFQIHIGGALGFDFFNAVLPALTFNRGTQNLAARYTTVVRQEQTGTFPAPGAGDQPVYETSYLLQWDLSGVAVPISSFVISFTGVQHAQIYGLRLDQSSVFTSLDAPAAVPEPASMAMLGCGIVALGWKARKRS